MSLSLQQLKKELDRIKQKIISENARAECLLSNAKEDLMAEINRMSEMYRSIGETYIVNAEELTAEIEELLVKRMEDPYFKRYVRGF